MLSAYGRPKLYYFTIPPCSPPQKSAKANFLLSYLKKKRERERERHFPAFLVANQGKLFFESTARQTATITPAEKGVLPFISMGVNLEG